MATEWSTVFPTSSDTLVSVQPDLTNSTSQGACDGSPLRVSFLHTLRDKLQAVCNIVGDNTKPLGSLQSLAVTASSMASGSASWQGDCVEGSIAKWIGQDRSQGVTGSYVVIDANNNITMPSGSNWGNSGSAWNTWHRMTGSLHVSGAQIALSASTKIFLSSSQVHIGSDPYGTINLTGSAYISGNISVQGLDVVRIGTTPTGMTSSYGVGTINHSSTPFAIYGSRTNGAGNESVRIVANVNSTSIDDNHVICKFGWLSSGPEFTGSWLVKDKSIEHTNLGVAEVLGTALDSATAVGTIVGTSASYVTEGAKLLSVQNAGQERECVYYDGTRHYAISNYGSYARDTYFSDILNISGANLYSAHYEVPAGASIIGVGARILTSLQTASVLAIGISASAGFGEYWGGSLGYAAGVANDTASLKTTWLYCPTGAYVCVSSSVLQGNAATTGSIRVECYYHEAEVPNS